jgi:hypothetical protein
MMLFLASGLSAQELETHSVYKVTTYNLGALLDDRNNTNLSLRNYEPLLITSTKADILNSQPLVSPHLNTTPLPNATRGFAISAEYNASAQIAVQGVFGVTKNNWESQNLDQNSSWEANLGLVYRFLDNLSYEIHFGYMETGSLLSERSSYSDVESIIMVSNKLTMSF